ncbi:MAG: CDP-alcohol phosphatidyltransferase family protein, partial [Nocardioidaceae bacterium]|nr:CDP-alcohol phosphatidyltransferase family protein [Nocardioidaceae bacterium]
MTVGLSGFGWVVGAACAAGTNVGLARALARRRQHRLGAADWVTLTRSVLVGGVAALAAESLSQPVPVATLVTLSASALALDAVDGWVARRTRTQSTLGARFDMEVDALLILVLSVYVAQTTGWWVLALGGAHYLFLAAGRVLPWLRESLPERYWCKVVAAVQGIVLTVVAG